MLNDLQSDEKDQKRDHRDNNADDDLFGQYDNITIGHNELFKKTAPVLFGGSSCEKHHPNL
jgi:hypothetical protein